MILRRVTAAGILATTVACANLRPVWDPGRFIAQTTPSVVYVMKGSVAVLTIANPRMVGDTLHGTLLGDGVPVTMPLSDVQNIGTVRFNGGRTAALVAGLAVLGGLTALVLTTSGQNNNWYCDFSISARESNGGAPICGPL